MKKIKPLRVGSPLGVSSYILAYTLQFLCGVSPGSARQRSPRNPRGGTACHMRAFAPVSFHIAFMDHNTIFFKDLKELRI